MGIIYIAEPGGQPTICSEEDAQARWQQGSISPQALYWREGMEGWRPAHELFGPGIGGAVAAPPAISSQAPYAQFRKDPGRLTRVLKVMLWIFLGVAIIASLLGVASLATGNARAIDSDELGLLDIAQGLIGLLQLMMLIATAVIFLRWTHRANSNVRGFGAQGMTFTPGWSVGYYFIPILNLWKPYQAMKEIWHTSRNPKSWSAEETPTLLSTWWGLWLISNFLGQMSLRLTLRAKTPDAAVASELVSLASDVLDIPLCLVAIKMVSSIYRMQCEWVGRSP